MVKLFQIAVFSLLVYVTAANAQSPAAVPATPATVPGSPAAVAVAPAAASAAKPGDNSAAAPTVPGNTVTPATAQAVVTPPIDMSKPFRGSFFLSPIEIAAIQEALRGVVVSGQTLSADSKAIPAYRVIRVSGVLYRAPGDWVVWMNNRKVTPDNLLPEIVDISVKDSSKVSLRWYDIGLNQVISITLRPHQTYDIVTGILIPGSY